MAVYTVHAPPRQDDDAIAHAARFVLVRDGFHFWAFLLTPLWMLRHRLWLELIAMLVILGALAVGLQFAGAAGNAPGFAYLLLAILIGIEASSLRRWKLARRGYEDHGIVVADSREAAERRFFDAFTARANEPTVSSLPAATALRPSRPPEVLGLFPEPGARP